MTKEEILEKHFKVDVDTSKYPKGYPYITEAMSEYAKQECISFCQWQTEEGFYMLLGTTAWECEHKGKQYSTEQLYELFKKSQSKEKVNG